MKGEIMLWDAIREMRETPGRGGEFSIVFMSYNRSKQNSHGPVRINRARLRPATPKDQNKNADFMLNILDLDENRPRQLYQVLIMELNGQKVKVD